jgi:hypothetical protein
MVYEHRVLVAIIASNRIDLGRLDNDTFRDSPTIHITNILYQQFDHLLNNWFFYRKKATEAKQLIDRLVKSKKVKNLSIYDKKLSICIEFIFLKT